MTFEITNITHTNHTTHSIDKWDIGSKLYHEKNEKIVFGKFFCLNHFFDTLCTQTSLLNLKILFLLFLRDCWKKCLFLKMCQKRCLGMKILQSDIVKSLVGMFWIRLIKNYAKKSIFKEIRSFLKSFFHDGYLLY